MKECKWLKPVRVAQIEFNEWTPDGHLRHSTFVGLRDDKEASDVVRKSAIEPNQKKGVDGLPSQRSIRTRRQIFQKPI
jgi:bifunctional non-homologous end joining protein LigD